MLGNESETENYETEYFPILHVHIIRDASTTSPQKLGGWHREKLHPNSDQAWFVITVFFLVG